MDAILRMYMNELTRRQDRSGEMNEELIQKLYQKSLARRNTEWGENIQFFDYRQFAKLIIDECVEVCMSRAGKSDYNTGRMHCASDLKEHFGIEE
jgi:hypothetical protein